MNFELIKPLKSTETVVREHGFVHRTFYQNPLHGRTGSGTHEYTCPFCYLRTPVKTLTWEKGYDKKCIHCGALLNKNGGRIPYNDYVEYRDAIRSLEKGQKNNDPLESLFSDGEPSPQ